MKIKNLKYTINHFDTGDIYASMPISTEVTIEVSENTPTLNETIVHQYRGEDVREKLESRKDLAISDPEIIQKLEQIDFDTLNDNYTTEDEPGVWETWSFKYGDRAPIEGTSDQEPEQITIMKELLRFDENYNKIRAEIEQAGEMTDEE